MNWLERARREISNTAVGVTANTANGAPTIARAGRPDAAPRESTGSIGSNGSTVTQWLSECDDWREAFEERAAIMEYDGGMKREDAEQAARRLLSWRRGRLH